MNAQMRTGPTAFHNLEAPRLYEEAIRRSEGFAAAGGPLVVETGPHTGRSPKDKFIVRDALTENAVWWENNQAMSPEAFDRLHADMRAHAREREIFTQDLHGCADPAHRVTIRVHAELAWHALFIRHLLIRPESGSIGAGAPDFTIIDLPSFRADPARHGCRSETVVALDFSRRIALIGGTRYAGEIKKAAFTFLNFLMPARGVLPMHCAANDHESGAAIFFGLSGTGKTTLSADSSRTLIGDDEHGWSDRGVFNFEGGCYAKAITLSRELEPEIHAASQRFGAVLENVAVDPVTRQADFDDDAKTENTRIAYPLDYVSNASATGVARHPKNVVMLTCDAFGVLPPIAKLEPAQAIYHFLSGYTARLAGTETGLKEPQATFSACFGAPFMPRRPAEYGAMLRRLIETHEANCWLINTGWTGGSYGVGSRMPLGVTRALLRGALGGALAKTEFRRDPCFGLSTPLATPNVDPALLDPAATWASRSDYAATAARLVAMFNANFSAFAPFVERDVAEASPRVA